MATSAAHIARNNSPYNGFDRLLIGGSWRQGRSNKRIRDLNLYIADTLLELASASGQDLNEAYAAAAAAQPKWAAKPPAARAAVMQRAAEIMIERQSESVSWLIHESGSTRLTYSEETTATLPEIMGGLSYALARCFKIVYPDLKNPQTQHWACAYELFNLLL